MSRSRQGVARLSRRTRLLVCVAASATGCGLLPSVAQAVPSNSGLPTISGTAQQGQALSLTQATWSDTTDPGITVTDEWEQCDANGANCTGVSSDATYTLTDADVGHTIEVLETATTASDGNATASSTPTAVVIPLAPANTTPPGMPSGTAQQGQTLTASTGSWSNSPTSYSYQWKSCAGTTCTNVGSDSTTYVVAATDVGNTIEVEVTATNAGGSGTPATSPPTATVIAAIPVNAALPGISGTPQQGQTLTASTGTWTNSPTSYAYQWENCTGTTCGAISGATGSTYVPTASDVGKTVEVQVTATNTGGASAPATSAPTAAVVPPAPTATFAPSISGADQQGSVLTEIHGGWTNTPTSYTYQWMRCDSAGANCAVIPGATTQTYTPTDADVGGRLVVVEAATNAGGSGTAYSALTPVITTPSQVVPVPVNSSPPTVAGITQQGQTLVESHGRWSGNPGSFSYQWQRCSAAGCAAIPGANRQTYTLTGADVGQAVSVLEVAANTGGPGAAAASARSGVIIATSSIALALAPATAATDQTVTLAATVNSGSANANPAGSLSFSNNGAPIAGCASQGFRATTQSITVICQAGFGAGTHQLAVSYQPGAGSLVGASTSAPQTLIVSKSSTSVSLAVTKQVTVRKRATYLATVVPPLANSGPSAPTGSIEFLDRGRPIPGCVSEKLKNRAATCVVKYKTTGSHRISARYPGDANFGGSTSPVRTVLAGKNASGPVTLGFISSTLQWKFYYTPKYTRILDLQAYGVKNGSTLRVTCRGPGCPFGTLQSSPADSTACPSRAHRVCSTGSSMNLLPAFRKRHLRPGARVILWITRPHWIGKYYSFTIRAGKPPLIGLSCVAVGRTRPGIGC